MDQHAFLLGLARLEVMRRHLLAGAAIDDHRLLGPEPPGGARDIHRGIAATVDDHPPAEPRRLGAKLHVTQEGDRI